MQLLYLSARRMSTLISRALTITKLGDPRKVLELQKTHVSTKLADKEVLIKWLASPINPLDIVWEKKDKI
jgi:NADPH:quinone reductase-like Zn-dependent oxidoreductase